MIEENASNQNQQDGGKTPEIVPESVPQPPTAVPETQFVQPRPLPDQPSGQIAAPAATEQEAEP